MPAHQQQHKRKQTHLELYGTFSKADHNNFGEIVRNYKTINEFLTVLDCLLSCFRAISPSLRQDTGSSGACDSTSVGGGWKSPATMEQNR